MSRAAIDRTLEEYERSSNLYFSSLLTFNGILLAFFSVRLVPGVEPGKIEPLAQAIIVESVVSVALLLFIFRSFRSNALDTFEALKLGVAGSSDGPEVQTLFARVKRRRQSRDNVAIAVEVLAVAELVCIVLLLAS